MTTTRRDGGAELVRRVRALPARRRRALLTLLRQQGVDLSALDTVPPRDLPDGEPVALSFAQQRLWFLAQLDGSSAAYNIPVAMRMRGPLDRPALLRALTAVVRRHEALRTRFVERDGVPYQLVGDAGDLTVEEEDLDDPAELPERCAREAATPFDLTRDPLLRVRLLRHSERDHALLVTMHHAVSDGWSVGVFVRELGECYAAFSAGEPAPLAPLPIGYADYAHWQRRRLDAPGRDRHLDFWTERLAGVDPRLTLPTDRPRPAVKTYRGARERFRCPAALLERLRAVGKRYDATAYMTLLAAYQLVLHRYTHATDIAVGTVVAGRNRAELEGLVGFFANTLVMRTDLSGDPDFPELLDRVRAGALAAYEHQDVPFEAVVDALGLERSLSHAPVFQTLFVLQEAQRERTARVGGLEVTPVESDVDATKFDLTLDLTETPDGLVGTVEYNTDLYDRETITRFVGHYTRLLDAIAQTPDAPLSRLEMLPDEERHRVLREWNDTERPFADDRCLHEIFEDAVRRHPERTALVTEDRSWTYAELNAWANRVAHALRGAGIGPDGLVGLCAERSAEMVAGILGTLKAGGAYVPVDPAYPAERIGGLLGGSGTEVVLTQPHLDAAPLAAVPHVLLLDPGGAVRDREGRSLHPLPEDDLPAAGLGLGPAHLAYVIHTSGSTGRPKGVMIEHRAAVNRVEWMQNAYGLTEDDVVLQKTPFSFDVSVWEFFWPLLYGARLAVAAPGGHQDPAYLVAAVRRFAVTTLHFVPSMLRAVVEDPGWPECTSVRRVFASGEALPPELCARHAARHPAPLHNLYGPTEAAVDVSHWTCPADEVPRVVPIGRPIQNIRLYVLNDALRPQGVGCVGQLHIAGVGLARGYLHQPELTRERFVPDPFGGPGERLYRTGDLARWRADGTLEFLGRADDQVKLRGFRIELGEIEHRLAAHPGVRACAVVLREDRPGQPRLVAYVVPADADGAAVPADAGDAADAGRAAPGALGDDPRAALQRHLERALPEHMVPGAYVLLDALPVTAHGKLDRKALPAPGVDAFAQRAYTAPRTGTERLLAGLWAELLGFPADRVGAEDDFFALGGHSLLITVLVARLRESGLRATVRDVFGAPVLAELAARLDQAEDGPEFTVPPNLVPPGCTRLTPAMLPLVELTQEQADTVADAVPGGAANVQDVYPLMPTQEGILFHHLLDPDHDPYLVSTLYVADDEAASTAFVRALQSIVDRHDAMRTAVLTDRLPAPVQVVHRTARLPVEHVRLDPDRDAEEQARALLDRPGRLALDQAPLLRLVVAEDPRSARRYLVLNAHHLIEDATSLRLTLRELALRLAGRAELLADPAPYRDFVAHTLHQQDLADTEAHFRAVLGDVTEPTTPFGLDDVRGDARRVRQLRRTLPEPLTAGLREQAQRLRLSPACLFHAAWARVVAATSGRDDVVFGTVMSGRLQGVPGVERMLGNFINTLPMRVRLAGRSVRELVADVDAGLRELLPRELSPLGLVQRCSGLDGDAPLFSAVANFRHFEPEHGPAAGVRTDDHGVRFLAAADGINYPVSVSLDDFGTQMSLDVQVDDAISGEAVTDYVQTALAGVVAALAADDGRTTAALDVAVLPEDERHRLLVEWNDTAAPVPAPTLPAAFAAQVARTPDRTALVHEDATLSYAEFDARANRLAHWLIERGAGPEVLVAVRMPRSFDLLTAIYGVLKSGAAYLPVDTDLPDERVERMLADGRPLLVLSELPDTAEYPDTAPDVAVLPDHPAYVLYTSGTTGRPKGVVITHRASMNWLAWDQQAFAMAEGERVLLKTSVSFDVSVKELFWPLQVGGSVVIARPGGQKDPEYLASVIRDQGVTDVDFVPSMLAEFLSEPAAAQCTGLRRLEATGEPLPVELAERVWRVLPDVALFNICGPTEVGAALGCRYHPEPGARRVPIGAPVCNTQAYVLDGDLRPLPQGVPGELYIAGDQLARGFLGRPALTAERFVANPFTPGTRMYRTGDLARWRPDGLIEHLGRVDDQLKVRGFRVEPGDVENALHTHPAVHRAVVVPRASGAERALVAYVSPTREWLVDAAEEESAAHLERWERHFDGQRATATAEGEADADADADAGTEPGAGAGAEAGAGADPLGTLRPKRLLVIGCGPGSLLFRYAEECASVHAVDLSAAALDATRRRVAARGWTHVTLHRADALAAVQELAGTTFDTVVLDSVVRCFPHERHLDAVLAGLLPLLADGGRVLVTDVGNLDLLPARACAAEHRAAAGPLTAAELAARTREAVRAEPHLLVSPTHFARLPERLTELGSVELPVRRGDGMEGAGGASDYRYDVLLTKGPAAPAEPHPWLAATTAAGLRELLDGDPPARFGVSGLAHPRVADALRLHADLARWAPGREVPAPGDARAGETGASEAAARELESALRHAESLGYQVALTWSQETPGALDAVFGLGELPPVRARGAYRAPRSANVPQLGRLGPATARTLKEHLAARLPEYMVPSAFVVLEQLPVTPNGKVDKRALPEPGEDDVAKETYVAPRTEAQRTLCRLVGEVLGVGRVGLQDTFLDLGGHSLLATRLTLRVRKETGAELPLAAIFAGATLEELAAALEREPEAAPEVPLPAGDLVREGQEAPLSLQQRDALWFLHRPAHLGSGHENVQLAFRVDGPLDRDAFAGAVRTLVERHAVLRTGYVRRAGGEWVQRVGSAEGFEVAVTELTGDAGHAEDTGPADGAVDTDDAVGAEVTQWLRAERTLPFAPEGPHQLRAHLLALSDDAHVAVLTRPWGVFDGWSVHLVLGELMAGYEALRRGEAPSVEPPPLGYADFARWQRRAVGTAELRRQLGYWRRALAGLPARPALRTDFPRGPVKSYQGSSAEYAVPEELLTRLRAVGQERGATLYTTLLAAFAVLVGGQSEDDDLVIGSAVSHRPRAELEPVVGYFVTLVALRLDVAGDRPFGEVLERARRVTTEAHEHKDVPFTDVARAVGPTPDPAHTPVFQTMFNLLPPEEPPPAAAGETGGTGTAGTAGTAGEAAPAVRQLTVDHGTARYDLNLVARETAGGLRGYLEYSTDLFTRRTAQRLARGFPALLAEIAADPAADVAALRSRAARPAPPGRPAGPEPAD
ncbi:MULTISPECIES: non-ribosomal peptide synthetase [Streptomyces]|uniref:non-ribosomal peptide synthetase n=1 Tax=Streptomyces TaxID=1883 RepID=UPI0022489CC6|nr:non-ribosomal peptide synthetase [Streptomyces sp. JHD 1]MCX2969327.1 amino acid adenylation domain-containing protein [Streptomyces sp. JHD 1]